VKVRVLGPLEVGCGEVPAAAGAPKQRTVLALLVVRANVVVRYDDFVDELWADRPPASAEANVRLYANNLRRVLAALPGAPVISRHGSGYLLTVDDADVDLHRFRRFVGDGRRLASAGDLAAAVSRYDAALRLWRGPFLADVPIGVVLAGWRTRTQQERLAAQEDRAEALLGLGAYERVRTEAGELLATEPLRERSHAQLIRASYQAGDVTAALAAFTTARRVLVDELGIEPGEELTRLHRAILNRDPLLAAPARPTGDRTAVDLLRAVLWAPVPRQLPADVPAFAGRAAELALLDGLLTGAAAPAVVISAVSGTAGVGKTALAVHWAHRMADEFPDGQLYVNLRGFDPTSRAMTPTEAMRGFLDALGVPPDRIPADLDGQVGRYRSLLAGKRMLVVLDNARDSDQVRPLLPGTSTAVVLITSRNQLTGLVALLGAYPLTLDLLSAVDARELLARRIGADWVTADPAATGTIIAACARLPLALAITAARARQRGVAPTAVAAELGDDRHRLDLLDAGDRSTQIRAVLSWSYTTLTPAEARAFRLLGLHPGADLSVAAVASLTGRPPVEARQLLTSLAHANLLTEHSPGRYTLHDLLRIYAAELARTHDSDPARRAAVTRLLDHYAHTAHAADRLLHPQREAYGPTLGRVSPGVVAPDLADDQQAMQWLTDEHRNLIAVLHHADETGFDTHAWQLARALGTFLTRRGHRQDLAVAWQTALHAATRLGDIRAQAHAHRSLAMANLELARYEDAHDHARQALDLDIRTGDRTGQAHTHRNTAYLYSRQGNPHQALHHSQQSLALFRAIGDQRGIANELNGVGWYHAETGDYAGSLAYCEQSLAMLEELRDPVGIAYTLDSLGYAHHNLGHHTTAIDFYQRALALHRQLGDRHDQADTLTRLGDTHLETGDRNAAAEAWRQALDILTELDHPDAEAVRAKLGRSTRGPRGVADGDPR